MKICCKCKQEKEFSFFCKSANRKDGYNPVCKDCSKDWRLSNKQSLSDKKKEYYNSNREVLKEKGRIKYYNNRDKYIASQRDYYSLPENRAKKILAKARERALKSGIEFSIGIEDVVIPIICPYLKIELTHDLGKGQLETNSSLDRIDSAKGYVRGNVQVISRLANTMKSNADNEQLIRFAKSVLEIHTNNFGKIC